MRVPVSVGNGDCTSAAALPEENCGFLHLVPPETSLKSQWAAPEVMLAPPGRWSSQLTDTPRPPWPCAVWSQVLGTMPSHVTLPQPWL